jgi:hypothetical protein
MFYSIINPRKEMMYLQQNCFYLFSVYPFPLKGTGESFLISLMEEIKVLQRLFVIFYILRCDGISSSALSFSFSLKSFKLGLHENPIVATRAWSLFHWYQSFHALHHSSNKKAGLPTFWDF